MDLPMDDYMDPYEEAEAEAAAEAAGLGGPAAKDSSDDSDEDDSEAESDYEEKSYIQLRSGNHRVRNPDGTFRCPFCPGKKKQDYKLKDLLQHADGIGVSSKHRRHGRERLCLVCPHRPVLCTGTCWHHWHSGCHPTC
jgi:hypothetical protein